MNSTMVDVLNPVHEDKILTNGEMLPFTGN